MTPSTTADPGADLFPELKAEPVRSFTETGWGRFPIGLMDARLNPQAFAVYCRVSVAVDSREPFDNATLADGCRLSIEAVEAAVEELQRRGMLVVTGETWTLTDPSQWSKQ